MANDTLGDIFGDDEEATSRRKSDLVGRVTTGYFDKESNSPCTLEAFRFTMNSPEAAEAIAQLFGGSPVENEDAKGEFFVIVDTDADNIPIIISDAGAISADQKLWANGVLFHHCTGKVFLDEERYGQPCGCPATFQEKKDAARAKRGPSPDIRVRFTLATDPELGVFELKTGAWTLRKVLHEVLADVERVGRGGAVLADLVYELVEYDVKKTGRHVSFRYPTVKARKAYDAAIADAPELDA